MSNALLFKKRTCVLKGPNSEDFLNSKITEFLNAEIPEGYYLKQVVSCNVDYDGFCQSEWTVEIIFILEKM